MAIICSEAICINLETEKVGPSSICMYNGDSWWHMVDVII